MQRDLLADIKNICTAAAAEVDLKERTDVQSIMNKYMQALSDPNIDGIVFVWHKDMKHVEVQVSIGPNVAVSSYCLHEGRHE